MMCMMRMMNINFIKRCKNNFMPKECMGGIIIHPFFNAMSYKNEYVVYERC